METYFDQFPKMTPPATMSEGMSFAQKGSKGKDGGNNASEKFDGELKPYNKKFFAEKESFNCGKKETLPNHAQTCHKMRVSHH